MDIVVSDDFLSDIDKMHNDMRRRVMNKIRLLSKNPAHPSLKAHRIERIQVDNIWECYITRGDRLIYEPQGQELRLWRVGDHTLIDHAHQLSFSPHTPFRRLDEDKKAGKPIKDEFTIPEEWLDPQQDRHPDNPYQYFPSAHLRILGVPSELVKAVRSAPFIEDLEHIPGLPAHTLVWLLELVTDPDFAEIVFDPGRLLFRTTLDRLEGYCEGQIKRLMLNLSEEQAYHAYREHTRAWFVRGCAGSGKTTVAVYRAIRLAENGDQVIFLTFNRTLAAVARTLIQELIGPLPANLHITHLDAWQMRFLKSRQHQLDIIPASQQKNAILKAIQTTKQETMSYILDYPWTFFRDEIGRVIKGHGLMHEEEYLQIQRYGRKTAIKQPARKVIWSIFQKYQAYLSGNREKDWKDWQDIPLLTYQELVSRPLEEPYAHVVIDEVQDLTPIQLRVAQRLNKGTKFHPQNSIFLVGDAAQTLYSRGYAWKQVGLKLQGCSATLRKNYRNTRQIADAAASLLTYNHNLKLSEEFVDPQYTNRMGPWPIVLECDVTDREQTAIIEKILSLIEDQRFRLSDFAILSPTNALSKVMQQAFQRVQIPSVIHTEDEFDILEEQVKVLTIHSAKGLEFPVVFLQGLHQGVLPRDWRSGDVEEDQLNLEQERTLMYVGMTRAAEALYLVTSQQEQSTFLNEINQVTRVEPFTGGKT